MKKLAYLTVFVSVFMSASLAYAMAVYEFEVDMGSYIYEQNELGWVRGIGTLGISEVDSLYEVNNGEMYTWFYSVDYYYEGTWLENSSAWGVPGSTVHLGVSLWPTWDGVEREDISLFGDFTTLFFGDGNASIVFAEHMLLNPGWVDNTTEAFSAAGDSQIIAFNKVNSIPEPASMLLLGTGIAGLAVTGLRRRRKK